MSKILDHDPLTGMVQKFDHTEVDGKTFIRTEQDVTGILERNIKLQHEEGYKKQGIKEEFQHVASIPLVVIHQWMKEGIDIHNNDHWPKIRQKLMDPDWRHLRTTLGNI